MTREDYIKAAEMVKPYQERINAILAEYKEEFTKTFGRNFNRAAILPAGNLSFSDVYTISPLFEDTKENIEMSGGEKKYECDSRTCPTRLVYCHIRDNNGDIIPNISTLYEEEL